MNITEKDLERFWSKVNKDGPVSEYRPDLGKCWIWLAGCSNKKYGIFWVNGHIERAHRVSFQVLSKKEIPRGLELDHLCRHTLCVRPSHLEAVTEKENVLRGFGPTAINSRKTHCIRGHEFTPENIYQQPSQLNARRCLTCARTRIR
jgi:hypothetical protein